MSLLLALCNWLPELRLLVQSETKRGHVAWVEVSGMKNRGLKFPLTTFILSHIIFITSK